MMKRILTLLCLVLCYQSAGCTSIPNGSEQHNRYVYCNVYAASACFGIASGDVMTMRIPVDFVTYDVELFGGTKVLIYSGYNPARMSTQGSSGMKKYTVPSGSYDYVLTSDGKHVITYTPNDNVSPLVQIVAESVGSSQKEFFADFLRAFRSCKSDGAGVVCDKERAIFKGVAQDVFSP